MISGVRSLVTKPMPGVRINPAHSLSRGLVGYWLFNEGAGSRANDISGRGNHCVLHDMAPNLSGSGWCSSTFGGGLAFDGSNDHGDCGTDTSLDCNDAITLAAWLRPTKSQGWYGIISKDGGYAFKYENYGLRPVFKVVTSGTSGGVAASKDLSMTRCSYVVGVYANDGTGSKIYVNGELSNTNTSVSGDITSTMHPLAIGALIISPSLQWPFTGDIDQVFVWNRALSAQEVKQHYNDPFCNLLTPRRWYVPSAGPSGVIMNQFQKSNIGADLYNGALA